MTNSTPTDVIATLGSMVEFGVTPINSASLIREIQWYKESK